MRLDLPMICHLPKSETPFILFEEYDILFHLEWLDSTVVTILLLWLVLFFSASLPSLWHFSRSCAYTPFPVDLDISLVTMSVGEAPKFTATRAPDLSISRGLCTIFTCYFINSSNYAQSRPIFFPPKWVLLFLPVMIPEFSLLI